MAANLKRAADAQTFESPPVKRRPYSVAGLDSSMRLIRRTPKGKDILIEKCLDIPSDDENDFFEDAQEDFRSPQMTDFDANGEDEVAGEEVEEDDRSETAEVNDHVPVISMQEGIDDEDEDLFASTFDAKYAPSGEDGEVEDDDSEIVDVDPPSKSDVNIKTETHDTSNDFDASEHTKGCIKSRAASTPPPSKPTIKTSSTPSPTSTATLTTTTFMTLKPVHKLPDEADLIKDLSPHLTYHAKLHHKAKPLIPRLHLSSHRYWIAVLHIDRRPKTFSSEKHFTWMKGNRLTTIETVWHTYSTTTFTEEFVLLLGKERVGFKERMEELDFFGDRFVCLRAVEEGSEEARGRELGEGVTGLETEGEKEVKVEVIEVLDDG